MKRKRGDGGATGQDAPLSEAALNVLVLGDGNLSYSLGLAKRLPNAKVLATSYDDSAEVRAKYADTSAIVARLLALGPRVRVRHGVDALAIAATLAAAAAAASTSTGGGEGLEREEPEVFDHVVFNHPHTGWEDMHRHAALLAHFLESCKAVLAPRRGQVHVTLAGEQPVRWRLLETAERLGYRLRHVCDFYRQFGPHPLPSEIKRHQSGKSFRLRGLPSFTFTFALGPGPEAAAAAGADADADAEEEEEETSPILWRHTYEDHAAVLLQPGADGAASLLKGAVTDVEKAFKCAECEKRFRGPKDLRKHVEGTHEQRALEEPPPTEALVCGPCGGRAFRDRAALEQHRRAKHEGHFQDLKPDWAQAQQAQQAQAQQQGQDAKTAEAKLEQTAAVATAAVPSAGEGGWREQLRFKGKDAGAYAALVQSDPEAAAAHALCAVCGYHVPTGVDHVADLRPPERPTFRCLGCERTFHEERALKQHANACRAFLVQLRWRQGQQQAQQQEAQQEAPAPAAEVVSLAAEA